MCELEGGGAGEPGHSNRVFCVKFDQDNANLIVSGGWDNNVKVWDIRQPSPVRSICGPFVCGDSIDLHDQFLLTGAYRDSEQLQLWDFGSMEPIDTISWDDGLPSDKPCLIYGAQFQKTTGDLIVAGGSGANEVKVFDAINNFKPCAQIKGLSRATFTVDFSN